MERKYHVRWCRRGVRGPRGGPASGGSSILPAGPGHATGREHAGVTDLGDRCKRSSNSMDYSYRVPYFIKIQPAIDFSVVRRVKKDNLSLFTVTHTAPLSTLDFAKPTPKSTYSAGKQVD